MLTDIPQELRKELQEARVIPFVGAGVSLQVRDRRSEKPLFPSWSELLLRAADRLEQKNRRDDANALRSLLGSPQADYLDAAHRAREWLGTSWYAFLREQLDPDLEQAKDESFALARAIWDLGSKLIITTNFDRVLWWACPDPIRKHVRLWKIQAAAEQAQLLRRGPLHPTLWYLHGTIEDAEGMILTPDRYFHLYPSDKEIEIQYEAALTTLRVLLIQHTFLFIGFSLKDPYLTSQLRWINSVFRRASSGHYALMHHDELESLRALELPVEPIPFTNYEESLPALVRSLSKFASDGDLSMRRLGTLAEKFPPGSLAAILELIAELVEDGSDPDTVLRHLGQIRKSADEGKVIEMSAGIAASLAEELHQRKQTAEVTDRMHEEAVTEISAKLSSISERRTRVSTVAREHLSRIRIQVTESFDAAINEIIEDLPDKLQSASLSDGEFFGQLKVRQMSRVAASICEQHIRGRLSRWRSECPRSILVPALEALWVEIMGEIADLQGKAIAKRIGSALTDEYILYSVPEEVYHSVVNEADVKSAVVLEEGFYSEFSLLRIIFLILTGFTNLNFRSGVEDRVKAKTAAVVTRRIKELQVITRSRLDQEISSIVKETVEEMVSRTNQYLDGIEREISKAFQATSQSKREAKQVLAQLSDASRRIEELRQALDESLRLTQA